MMLLERTTTPDDVNHLFRWCPACQQPGPHDDYTIALSAAEIVVTDSRCLNCGQSRPMPEGISLQQRVQVVRAAEAYRQAPKVR